MNVVMMGASGAVGGQVLERLLKMNQVNTLTLLGRKLLSGISEKNVKQHNINIFDATSYVDFLSNHNVAICTLGVGQPSKMSKEDFLKIDKYAVLDFAVACKNAGIKHFELLASVGIDAKSTSFYLRSKGALVEEIEGLNFERFSVFLPSMILTPTNRYGIMQALTLKIWPLLKPFLMRSLRKYRGIKVETLGKALANNILVSKSGTEYLDWDDFLTLGN